MIDLLSTADVAIAIDSYPQPWKGEADDRTKGGVTRVL